MTTYNEREELRTLVELLEKYKDKIYLNMSRDTTPNTRLRSVKTYGESILLHSEGYDIRHEEQEYSIKK